MCMCVQRMLVGELIDTENKHTHTLATPTPALQQQVCDGEPTQFPQPRGGRGEAHHQLQCAPAGAGAEEGPQQVQGSALAHGDEESSVQVSGPHPTIIHAK